MSTLTRRGLFGLAPTALIRPTGLITCLSEPSPAPQSDPIAVAANNLGGAINALRVCTEAYGAKGWVAQVREAESLFVPEIEAAERQLKQLLSAVRGTTVLVQDRAYTSGRGRPEHVVKPVYVQLLAPAKGGAR